MVVTADQVAATIALLVPGFVGMKVFYVLGFQTKRSDAQWAIWSILASAPLLAIATALTGPTDGRRMLAALALAVAAGAGSAVVWRLVARFAPQLRDELFIHAWDNVLGPKGQWVVVEMRDGRRFKGWTTHAGKSVDTESPDLYLTRVKAAHGTDYIDVGHVDGLLVDRSQITLVLVLSEREPTAVAEAEPAPAGKAASPDQPAHSPGTAAASAVDRPRR